MALLLARCAVEDFLAESPGEPVLSSTGRVWRHRVRGGPVHDARAERQAADAASRAGMRDPALLLESWPQLWTTMAKVAPLLLAARSAHRELRDLQRCLGDAPSSPPPPEALLAPLRAAVGALFGMDAGAVERRHPATPWRGALIGAVGRDAGDPDTVLSDWLMDGAPMGIEAPIVPGGLFPLAFSEADATPAEVLSETFSGNHPSFTALGAKGPGWQAVADHVAHGFGELHDSQAALEKHLGSRVAPAPMGVISKLKPDGVTEKHRVIMDLRRNRVNEACCLPERQVLPTWLSHAVDLAILGHGAAHGAAAEPLAVMTLILDLWNAFMNIPLADVERPFNVAVVEVPVERGRPPLFEGEPGRGTHIAWRVLGFGGKPNPLVFARAASFAARTAQALLRPRVESTSGSTEAAAGRLQFYVDDPVLTLAGTGEQCSTAVDMVLLWWLVLGIPLAWAKGSYHGEEHRWIGALFALVRIEDATPTQRAVAGDVRHFVLITVPADLLKAIRADLAPFLRASGTVTRKQVDHLCGRAGRLAYLVPAAKPFVAGLWGALAGARRDAPGGDHLSIRRFATPARWLSTLLDPPGASRAYLPLEHVVTHGVSLISAGSGPTVEFDASPWGGGALLKIGGYPAEYFEVTWKAGDARHLGIRIGEPAGQTTWELATLVLALVAWATRFRLEGLAVLGDNTAALEVAINLRSCAALGPLTRELAWRKVRLGWRFSTGHLPAELNGTADALSRTSAPDDAEKKSFPSVALRGAHRIPAPVLAELWTVV